MASIRRFHLASKSRRSIALACVIFIMAAIALVIAWPTVVRHVVISELETLTHRKVTVDALEVNPFTGRIMIRGFRVLEREGGSLFTDFERLDVRVKPLALLGRHLWIRDLVLRGSTVRVIRFADNFNLSDLVKGKQSSGPALDVTVDRFVVTGGTITLEDRALSEPRTWRSESIEIEAKNLSTRRADGTVMARSVTAGAPVSLQMQKFRLYPIHFEAVVTTTGLDLGPARLYLPADAPFVLERGRATSTLAVVLDARDGLRANITGEMEDVALTRPGERDPVLVVPKATVQLSDFLYRDDKVAVGRFELAGSANVLEPGAGGPGRHHVSTLRASIADVTWPVTMPGRLDVEGAVPGGGSLRLIGTLRPPPAASQLKLRLASVDLAPWAHLLPVRAHIAGLAGADLSTDEPLAPGVPSRIQGSVAVNRLGIGDGRREVIGADRVAATGFEMHWSTRLAVKKVVVSAPRATVERDKTGELPLRHLFEPAAHGSNGTSASAAGEPSSFASGPDGAVAAAAREHKASPMEIAVGELVVKNGRVTWRDDMVNARSALDFAGIDVAVTGASWPVRGPLTVRASAQPPDGGQVRVAGRVGIDPLTADVRVSSTGVAIAPYQSYLPIPARIAGRADLDFAVVLPPLAEGRAVARGNAAISQVDVRDGVRTIMRVERAAATGVELDWPRRAIVRELAMQQPWVLLERDREGALTLRTLLSPRVAPGPKGAAVTAGSNAGDAKAGEPLLPVTIERLTIDDGGARVVDHRIVPPFALDIQRLAARVDGLSTDPGAKAARLELTGRLGGTSLLGLRGTLGSLGGPLRVDVNGDLRGFEVPRTNPYLLGTVAWQAREGWLTTTIRCRIDKDALDARTEVQVSRLQVTRAGGPDEAKARIGLPLGMIVSLMKDSQGDIRVALPVTGRLSDPRFDFSEAIWSTIRNVVVKAITAPLSWIGRVRYTDDARIDSIDLDPIPFAPGQAVLGPDAREQVSRVATFLGQAPEVRLALTPVVSSHDAVALGQGPLDKTIERIARDERLSPEAAAARLFKERFPGEPVPATADALRAALASAERGPAPDLTQLAARRLEAVRDGIKKAGIDGGRLKDIPAASTAPDTAQGQVKLDLAEPESPGTPGRPNLLKRIFSENNRDASPVRN